MKNIYDIRAEKDLYFLLSEDLSTGTFSIHENVAIIIYLYYEETLERYLDYLKNIPKNIQIYIVTSSENVYKTIEQLILKKGEQKIELVIKENRGRDISALLVACREICLRHKYICFIHDKKKKDYIPETDFCLWMDNLWGNTLGSENYILNVLNLFESNEQIGVLAPPEPMGQYLNVWYVNGWGKNFELTQKLAKELNLHCNLSIDKSPITLGTVFWARSDALQKILKKEWKYEDFDEEPLKDDGTISHVIERIIGYVAQDAGYDVGTVMNLSYASKLLSYTQRNFWTASQLIQNGYGLSNIEKFSVKSKELFHFCMKYEKVYLYGAGKIGICCLHLLRAGGFEPKGYIVSHLNSNHRQEVEGVSIDLLENINGVEKIGIIITVDINLQSEIENNLQSRGLTNYIKYIEKD